MSVESGSNGFVTCEVDDGVADVRLNDPERLNCFSLELVEDLDEVTASIHDREDVRAVVITGEGDAFCTGADTDVLTGADDIGVLSAHYDPAFERLLHGNVPVVVGAKAYAVGAGASLLTYVPDLAFVDPALELWWPEVHHGLLPRRATAYLHDAVGYKRTLALMLFGEEWKLDAATALEAGLVTDVVDADGVDERARWAARYLADVERETGLVGDCLDLLHRLRREAVGGSLGYALSQRRLERD